MLESSFALNMKERSLMNINLFGEKAGATVFRRLFIAKAWESYGYRVTLPARQ